MYLKKLTLHGFKSFADRTAFDFAGGITSIVGPNGCGKSNVVDALKWIFGNQSAKELRGQEMKDVIFAGTTARRPVNFAEVAVIFDNEDKSLRTEHAEVAVERRLFRSGESEYRLNGMKCRLKDIRDLFTDTGIGQESYSILEQGKIDLLIQSSPVERRVLFEEAAGISRYRMRREEALRQLSRTEDNLLRLNDIVGEIESRIRGVRIQAGRARRYRELETELRQLRMRLGWEDLMRIYKERAEWTFRQDLVHKEIATLDGSREALERELAYWEEDRRAAEEDRHARTGELGNARGKQQSIRETIAVTEKRIGELTAAGERWAKEAEDAQASITQYSAQVEKLGEECDRAEAEEKELAQVAAAHGRDLEVKVAELAAGEGALAAARRDLVDTLDALTSLRNQHSRVAADEQLASARMERLRAEEARVLQSAAAVSAEEADARNSLAAVTAERAEIEAAKARLEQDLGREETHLEEKARQLGETRSRLHALTTRRELLSRLLADLDGVDEATRRVIHAAREGDLPQVRGLLAEMLGADAEDARAIESALGPWAQAIVVGTRDELAGVRAYLGPEAAFAAICLEAIEAHEADEPQTIASAEPTDAADAAEAPEAVPPAEDPIEAPAEASAEALALAPFAPETEAPPQADAALPAFPAPGEPTVAPEPGAAAAAEPSVTPLPAKHDRVLVDFWAAAFAGEPLVALQCTPSVVLGHAAPPAAESVTVAEPMHAPAPRPRAEPAVQTLAQPAPVQVPRTLPPFPAERASDLVTCPEELAPVVRTILARTLIVDDRIWESVLHCPDWQLVTTSGSVREPWGGVRWGVPTGVLVRRSELSHCVEEIALVRGVDEELAAQVAERKTALAHLKEQVAAAAEALTKLHGRIEALEELLKHTERRANDLAVQGETIAKESHALREDLAALQSRLADLAAQLTQKELARIAGEQAVTANDKAVTELRDARRTLEQTIAELRVKEAGARENARGLREARLRLEELLRERGQHLEEARAESARAAQLAAHAGTEVAALHAQHEEWERKERECAEALAQVEARMETVTTEIKDRERGLATLARTHEQRRQELADIQLEERELAVKAGHIVEGVREEYGVDLAAVARGEVEHEEIRALAELPPDESIREKAADLKDKLARHGNVNLAAIDELKELEDRFGLLATQRDDLVKAKTHLVNVINDLNRKSRRIFAETFDALNKAFGELFRKAFGGGKAELLLEEGKDILSAGIEIIACPPGKKPSHIRLLSGGERTLTTLTLLFAVLRVRPTPFCVLDEVDAPLDEANIRRFLVLVDEFTQKTQFLVITHNKLTMVKADRLVGITMEEKGVSKTIDINIRELERTEGTPDYLTKAPAMRN